MERICENARTKGHGDFQAQSYTKSAKRFNFRTSICSQMETEFSRSHDIVIQGKNST